MIWVIYFYLSYWFLHFPEWLVTTWKKRRMNLFLKMHHRLRPHCIKSIWAASGWKIGISASSVMDYSAESTIAALKNESLNLDRLTSKPFTATLLLYSRRQNIVLLSLHCSYKESICLTICDKKDKHIKQHSGPELQGTSPVVISTMSECVCLDCCWKCWRQWINITRKEQ